MSEQRLAISSLPNLRDVGGHPTRSGGRVRTGLLYRSAELSRLAGSDAAAFARLGIRSIYDLRSDGERTAQPDRLPPGTEYVVLDVVRDSPDASPAVLMDLFASPGAATEALGDGRAAAMWTAMYRELLHLASARAGFRRLFIDLAAAEHRPALVHCTTGKDRTGWAAAALLLFLGVPDEVVLEDYLQSGPHLQPMLQPVLDQFRARGGDPEVLRPLMDVRAEYLAAALDEVARSFGTIEDYFGRGLGIEADGRLALRAAFLESV